MAFLAELHDPELDVPSGITAARITTEEKERLTRMTAVASLAVAIPRRVGSDATPEELAIDKKRARRVKHALEQCLFAWEETKDVKLPENDVLRQEAATIVWESWWEEHQVYLESRVRLVVTWTYKTGADERWTKSAVVKFQNEIRWLSYAMRE
jgi:hypothetical protein